MTLGAENLLKSTYLLRLWLFSLFESGVKVAGILKNYQTGSHRNSGAITLEIPFYLITWLDLKQAGTFVPKFAVDRVDPIASSGPFILLAIDFGDEKSTATASRLVFEGLIGVCNIFQQIRDGLEFLRGFDLKHLFFFAGNNFQA